MKQLTLYFLIAVLVVSVIGSGLYLARMFSAAITPAPTVTRPAAGMVCAHIITADGAAISCIQESKERAE